MHAVNFLFLLVVHHHYMSIKKKEPVCQLIYQFFLLGIYKPEICFFPVIRNLATTDKLKIKRFICDLCRSLFNKIDKNF